MRALYDMRSAGLDGPGAYRWSSYHRNVLGQRQTPPLGNDRFKEQVEAMVGRTIGQARRGGPKRRRAISCKEL